MSSTHLCSTQHSGTVQVTSADPKKTVMTFRPTDNKSLGFRLPTSLVATDHAKYALERVMDHNGLVPEVVPHCRHEYAIVLPTIQPGETVRHTGDWTLHMVPFAGDLWDKHGRVTLSTELEVYGPEEGSDEGDFGVVRIWPTGHKDVPSGFFALTQIEGLVAYEAHQDDTGNSNTILSDAGGGTTPEQLTPDGLIWMAVALESRTGGTGHPGPGTYPDTMIEACIKGDTFVSNLA